MTIILITFIAVLCLFNLYLFWKIRKAVKRLQYEMTSLYDDVDDRIIANQKVVYLGRSDQIRRECK